MKNYPTWIKEIVLKGVSATSYLSFWLSILLTFFSPLILTPSDAGAVTGSTTLTVESATQLAITSTAQTVVAGNVSNVVTVEARHSNGNVDKGFNGTVNLTSTSTTMKFDTSATGPFNGTIASITLSSGSGSFYFKDTTAGSPTITVSFTGLTSATQVETITAGAPTKLAITSSSQTVTAGVASSAVTVQAQDTYGNLATSSAVVSLASTSGTMKFDTTATGPFNGTVTSITLSSGTGTFYFKDTKAGLHTITVSATGLTSGSQIETITAASATALYITSTAQTVVAGSASSAVTVEARDTYGNVATGFNGTVNLTTTSGTMKFDTSATGLFNGSVTSITLSAGTGSLYFKDTKVGSPTVTISSMGLTSASQIETIVAGPATKLAITSASQSVTAGFASSAITVESQDAYGNLAASSAVVGLSSTSGTMKFDTSATGAFNGTVTSITLSAGSGSFYFKDTTAGSPTITIFASGLVSTSQVETITAGAATKLAITSAAQTVTAGAVSSAVTVQAQDTYGNLSTGFSGTANLTYTSGTMKFDTSATGPFNGSVTSITLSGGSGSFYFKDTTAGSPTITVSSTGLTSASQVETITAGPATLLAITSLAQMVTAGAVSSAVSVQAQDTYGNLASSSAVVSLASTSGTMKFDTSSTGPFNGTVTSITLSGGSGSFYFKDTVAGPPTITVSATGLTSASQVETINAAIATRLAITSAAQTVTAGVVSSIVTVQAQDNYGNLATGFNGTASITYTSGTMRFDTSATGPFNGTVTSIVLSGGAGNFYFKDTTAGSHTITVSTAGLTSASQVETIVAASATALYTTSVTQTVVAGSVSSAVTVEARDTYGNVATGFSSAVNLSSTSGTMKFDTSATGLFNGTITSITLSSGTGSFYFKDTTTGWPTITISATGLTSASQTETVVAAAATALYITTSVQTLVAGAVSSVVNVQARDTYGNVATGFGGTVSLASTSGTMRFDTSSTGSFSGTVTSITLSAGAGSFYFKDTTAGSHTITVSSTGLTSATQVETVTAGSAIKLAITSAAQTVTAGAVSSVVTVQAQDTYGNLASSSAVVSLASTSGTMRFDTSATGLFNGTITSITLSGGAGSFYFKDTKSGSHTITVSTTGLTSASQVETVVAATATALYITSTAQTVVAGAVSSVVTVEARDTYGNIATGFNGLVNITYTSGTMRFDTSPTGPFDGTVTSITLSSGTGSFYFKDTKAGSPTITLSATGVTSASQVETITAGSPTKLAITSSTQTVTAGVVSSAVTVQAQDTYGNIASSSAVVSISSTSGTMKFDTSATGLFNGSVTSITLSGGTGSFYFKDTTAGSPTITISSTGLTSASQSETIMAASATALYITSVAQTVVAGTVSSAVTIQARDTYGNVATGFNSAVSFASTSGTMRFDTSATGLFNGTVTSITLSDGTGSFYFKDTTAGSPTITVTATGITSTSQVETITAGTATKLSIISASQIVTAGVVSSTVNVQTQDAYGNLSSSSAVVNLASTSSTMKFDTSSTGPFNGTVTSITLSGGTGSFYFKDTTAGSPSITVSSTGLTSASQVETITAATASALYITSTVQTVVAGAVSSAVTIQARDTYGNVATGFSGTVNLSSTSGTMKFDTSATGPFNGTVTSITLSGGTSSFYFKDTTAGSPTITVSSTGLTSASQVETITAGPATKLAITSLAQTVTAGVVSSAVTVQAQDTYGNLASSSAIVTLSSTSGTMKFDTSSTGPFNGTITSITLSGGTGNFYFKDTTAGSHTVTVSATGLTSASQIETINPSTATKLVITSAAQTVTAGVVSSVLTVQAQDNYGNLATGFNGTASITYTSGTMRFDTSSTGPFNGTVTSITLSAGAGSFYFKDTTAGSHTITVSTAGLTSASQVETIVAASATALYTTSVTQTVVAGSVSSAVTVEARDTYGNVATGFSSAVNLSSTSGTMKFDTSATGLFNGTITSITLSSGTGSFYFKDTTTGWPTITISATGLTSASQTETVVAAAATALYITSTTQTLVAGSVSSVVNVQARDTYGNVATGFGGTVSLASTSGTMRFDTSSTGPFNGTVTSITLSAGVGSFYFKDNTAGSHTITVSSTGLTSATQVETVTAGSAVKLAITSAAQTMTAGAVSSVVTVQAQDTYGNLASSSAVVSLASTSGTMRFDTSATGPFNGTITSITLSGGAGSFYFKDTKSGSHTITVSTTGLTSASQVETVVAATATALYITSTAQTVVAGAVSSVVTVEARDTYGNIATGFSGTVNLTSMSGTMKFDTSAAGSFTGAVTSITLSGGSGSFYFKDTKVGSPTITISATGLTSANQTETITPAPASALYITSAAQTVVAGMTSSVVTVEVRDAFGNIVTGFGSTVNLTSTSGTMKFDTSSTGPFNGTVTSITLSSGTGSFYFKDTTAGSHTVTVSYSGLTSGSQIETITPAAASTLYITSAAQTVVAGTASSAVTVQARDAYGNVATAYSGTGNLVSTSGTMRFDTSATGLFNGAVTSIPISAGSGSFYFKDTTAGSPTITVSATGLISANQVETIVAGTATQLAITSAYQTVTAGVVSSSVIVQAQDTYGNLASSSAVVNLTSTSGTMKFDTSSTGPFNGTITSITLSGGTGSFYFKDTTAGSHTITVSATGLTSGSQVEVITAATATALYIPSAAQTVMAGAVSSGVTVQARDAYGNVATGFSGTVNISSTSSTMKFDTSATGPFNGTVTSIVLSAGSGSFYFKDTKSGSHTITVSSTGLTSTSQTETITAATASALYITSAAQTVVAGAVSSAVTVEARDTYGNVATGFGGTMNLSSTSSTTRFDTSATGLFNGTVTSITLSSGAGSFYFKDTTAGSPAITISSTGMTSASQTETINPGPVAKLAITSAAQTVIAGVVSSAVTVQSQDTYGNLVSSSAVVNLASTSGTMKFDTSATGLFNGTVTSFTLSSGAGSFYFKDTKAGSHTITVSSTGLTSGSQVETVVGAAATALFITSASHTVVAGAVSSAVTIEARDTYGNVASGFNGIVNITYTSGTMRFDTSPTGPFDGTIASITLSAGTGSFYFKDTTAGSPTITVSSAGLTSASQVETITSGPATKLAITSAAQTVTAGVASSAVTVQSQDTYGNLASSSAVVNLTSTSSTMKFDTSATGLFNGTITSITLSGGAGSFYFKDTKAGSHTITVSSTGLTSGSQVETIVGASATALFITSAAQTVVAGSVSSVVTVEARDTYGNVATGFNGVVNITYTSGTMKFDTSATGPFNGTITSVTLSAGTGSFYFKDTTAGPHTITISSAGLTSASQVETIVAATATTLYITSSAQTVVAGAVSSSVTVQARDTYGNVATGFNGAGNLTSTSGTMRFDTSSTGPFNGTVTSITLSVGTGIFYFKDTIAGSPTITVSSTGLTSASQTETVVAGSATKLVITSAAQTVTAGVVSSIVTVQAQDAYGNLTSSSAVVNLTSTSGTMKFDTSATGLFNGTVTSITLSGGTGSFYFKDTTAGLPTNTLSSTGLTSASQTETITAGSATKLAITSVAQTVTAGAVSSAVTVQAQDAYGNLASSSAVVNLTSTSGTMKFDTSATGLFNGTVTSITLSGGMGSFYFKDTTAGSPTITVSATGLTSASQTETIGSATPSALFITSAAQTVVAGAASSVVTVEARDSFGNLSTGFNGTVNLSSTSSTMKFDTSATGAFNGSVTSITMSGGTGSFYFKDTAAGSPTITVSSTGLTSASQTETIVAGSATKLAITSVAQTVTAGAASSVVTVQAQDAYGNLASSSAVVSFTSTSGTMKFDTSATGLFNGTITSITLSGGTGSFYFKDTTSGSPTITVSATGLTSASQTETITAAAATKLVITSAAQTVTAGTVSSVVTIQAQDTYGNLTTSSAVVSLSSNSVTMKFDTSATGLFNGTITSSTLSGGTGSFYFKDTTAGSPTITVASTGLTSAIQTETIVAGSATKLAITSAAQTVTAGVVSSIVTVQAQDTYGNLSSSSAVVSLASNSGTMKFDTSATGLFNGTVTSITLSGGSGNFYFKDTTAGSHTITVSATGLTSATQVETVVGASATALYITSTAQTLVAGAVSSAVTVEARDTYGNIASGSLLVGLSSTSATMKFDTSATGSFNGTVTSITLSGSPGSFFFKDTTAGSPTITVSSTGVTSASQTETITAGSAAKLAITSAAQTVTAGVVSSVVTVQAQDTYGNLASSSAVVSLASTSGTMKFDTSATGLFNGTVTSITLSGGTGNFYFKDTTAGSHTITVSATGLTSGNQVETVTAAAATKIVITSPAQTVTAGAVSSVVTVQAQDTYSNLVTSFSGTVSLSYTSSTMRFDTSATGPFNGTITSITLSGGTGSFYFKDTTAGFPTITVSTTGLTSASQTETITAASATKLVIASAAQSVTAGAVSSAVTVQSQDTYGNLASSNAVVSVVSTSGTMRFDTIATGPFNGTVTSITLSGGTGSFYFKDTTAGSHTVTLSATGLTSASQVETITAAAATKLVITTPAQTVTAGAVSSAVTVQAQDTYGNLASGFSGTVNLSYTSGTMKFDTSPTGPFNGTIISFALSGGTGNFYFKDTTAGSPTITVSTAGLTSASQAETITAASATKLVITSIAQTVTAGAVSSAVTVQAQDTYGNLASSSAVVSLTSTSSTMKFDTSATGAFNGTVTSITLSGGTGSFYFKDTIAGSPTITVSATGLTSASQTETITAASATKLVITSGAQTVTAGAVSSVVTVQAQDTYGNLASSSAVVSLTSTSGTMKFDISATGAFNGTVTSITLAGGIGSFYFKDTTAGSPTITVSATGLTSTSQTETITAASATKLVITSPPQTVAAGNVSSAVTIQAQDTYGNLASISAVVSLTSTSGTMKFDTSATGAFNGTVTSITLSGGNGSFYFKDTTAGSPTITVSATGLTSTSQTETIMTTKLVFTSVAQTVVAGAVSSVVTIQSQDVNGNLVSSSAVVNLTSTSGTMRFDTSATGLFNGTVTSITLSGGNGSFYFKDTAAGSPTITVSSTEHSSGSQVETITPASASALYITSAAQTVVAGSVSSSVIIEARDTYGNIATGFNGTVNLTSTSSTMKFDTSATGLFNGTITSITLSSGTGSFYFKDTTAGSPTVTVSSTGLTSASQVETITAGSATKLVITTPAQTVTAGVVSSVVTVQSQDTYGNLASSSAVVSLASTSGTMKFDTSATGLFNGTVTSITLSGGTGSFYFKDTTSGSPTITVSTTGLTSGSQTETITAGSATKLAITSPAQSVTAGVVSSVVTVQAQDTYGNLASSSAVVNLTSTSGTMKFDTSATGLFNGTVTSITLSGGTGSFYFKDTAAGLPTITVSSTGLTSASQTETITAATATKLVITSAAQTIVVGAVSSAVTVQAQDTYGNLVSSSAVVSLTSTSGTMKFDTSATGLFNGTVTSITLSGGTGSFYFKDTAAGLPTITVSSTGLTSASQTETITAGSATKLAITTPAQTVTAGVASSVVTVQSQDTYGNLVSSSAVVSLTSTSGTMKFDTSATGLFNGTVTSITLSGGTGSFYFKDTTAGLPTITVSSTGLTSASQTETITAATAAKLVITSAAQTLTAGVVSSAVTVQAQDTYGNLASSSAVVSLSSTSGTMKFDMSATGPFNGTITSITLSGGTGSFYFKDTTAGSPTITVSSTGLTSASQTEIITPGLPYGTISLMPSPAIIPADGTSTSTITSGTIKDVYGNTVANGTLITVSATLGTITTADADAGTPGIQVATTSGIITFTFKAGTAEGTANVTATSVQGSASGQASITLTNVVPELIYPTETGYGSGDALEPNSGIRSTTYKYKIIYKDVNNNLPSYVRVCIDLNPCAAMSLDTGAIDPTLRDGSYSNGEQYVYTINTLTSGDHTYYFETSDGLAYTKLPSTGSLSGPHVNYPPVLSYSTEAGYGTDGVNPDSGNTTTTFYYKVVYTDNENQGPTSIRVCIDGGCNAMSLDTNASTTLKDGNYTNGEQYVFSKTLTSESHTYYFDTTDGLEGAVLPSSGNLTGPKVTSAYTPLGTNVIVEPYPGVTVIYSSVTDDGETSVTYSSTGTSLPSGYEHGEPPQYFGITPYDPANQVTTTVVYSGKVTVCRRYPLKQPGGVDIFYGGTGYGGEKGVRLLHYEGSGFTDRTSCLNVNNISTTGTRASCSGLYTVTGDGTEYGGEVCGIVSSFSEFVVAEEQATLVTLTSFRATGMDGKVALTWSTASEIDSIGFNILRGTAPNGPFIRINDWLSRSKGTPTRGMIYSYEDIDVENGVTYFYRLENVDINGRIAAHMMASATPVVPATTEAKPQVTDAVTPSAPGQTSASSTEVKPQEVPDAGLSDSGIMYREAPATIGEESIEATSESPVEVPFEMLEGEKVIKKEEGIGPVETGSEIRPESSDKGPEAIETRMPGDRTNPPLPVAMLRGNGSPAPLEKGGERGIFTLRIEDDEGNEIHVRLPEDGEKPEEPFGIKIEEGGIALTWSAKGNLKGFNIMRSDGEGKEFKKVNTLPIPFFASQAGEKGLIYGFKDAGVAGDKLYRYKLETILREGIHKESRAVEISTDLKKGSGKPVTEPDMKDGGTPKKVSP